jgi:hypothetical protein
MLGEFNSRVDAAEQMQARLPAGEPAATWKEILSLVRQSLAVPPLWPNLESPPRIYFNVYRRPLNQIADLFNVALDAAISPAMLARSTAGLVRKYPSDDRSISAVLAIMRRDGRRGCIVQAVSAVLDMAAANREQEADGVQAVLLQCGTREERLQAVAAAVGALAADNPSSPLIVPLLIRLEADAGPLSFGRREASSPIVGRITVTDPHVDPRGADQGLDIAGVERQGALEESPRLRSRLGSRSLVQPSSALEIKVHRIGLSHPFRAARLCDDELRVERPARRATISSCMSKRSAEGLSNRSAQR